MFDFSNILSDSQAIILLAVLILNFAVLAVYYALFHFRIGLYHRKESTQGAAIDDSKLPPISVVLTARNDAVWLKENLVYLLEQDYPNFEVVVVDYLSQDDTRFVLKLLKDYYTHLKVVPFKEDVNLFQGKKYPLSIGIKSAKHDILMLADPDCTPRNPLWLRGMVRGYFSQGADHPSADTQMVLGYCGLKRTSSFLGLMQQYDNLAYSCHYLGCALLGHPYTGSGRNLSYRRSFFFDRGAFISHYDVAGGADDLFVYQNATRDNTAICIDHDACLTTEPRKNFAQWHHTRLDRVSTRNRHSIASRLSEEVMPLTNLLFYASAVLMAFHAGWGLALIAVVLKWAWQIVAFAQPARRFDAGLVYLAAPLLEIYFILANTILILTPLRSNRKFK
ncbi:MAG: glycosyltransferase [Bacteroidales bacterium]|nr:glycosyltransferase [Bacteroidales bacterium]